MSKNVDRIIAYRAMRAVEEQAEAQHAKDNPDQPPRKQPWNKRLAAKLDRLAR